MDHKVLIFSNLETEGLVTLDYEELRVVAPQSESNVEDQALFLLFPPTSCVDFSGERLDQYVQRLKNFLTSYREFNGACVMLSGIEAYFSSQLVCQKLKEYFGLNYKHFAFKGWQLNTLEFVVAQRRLHESIEANLLYDEALSSCEPALVDDQASDIRITEESIRTIEELRRAENELERSSHENESLKLRIEDVRQELNELYLAHKALERSQEQLTEELATLQQDKSQLIVAMNSLQEENHRLIEKNLPPEKEKEEQEQEARDGKQLLTRAQSPMLMEVVEGHNDLLKAMLEDCQADLQNHYFQSQRLQRELAQSPALDPAEIAKNLRPRPYSEFRELIPTLFDESYFRNQVKTKLPALLHYRYFSGKKGVVPHPLFDVSFYLQTLHTDLESLPVSPLWHFLSIGAQVNLDISPHFNSSFYLRNNPDVLKSGACAIVHYLTFGWKEGRDPNPNFSSSAYLGAYPDVAQAGMNPLVHYVLFGEAEGRHG